MKSFKISLHLNLNPSLRLLFIFDQVVCILKVYMSVVAIVLLIEVIFMAVCVALRGKHRTTHD